MEHLDRFAILRQMLPQDRYGDVEVVEMAERCCELVFRRGAVLVDLGQLVDEWLVVVEGEVEVANGAHSWAVGPGAIVHPGQGGTVSALRLVATRPTTVLQITAERQADRDA